MHPLWRPPQDGRGSPDSFDTPSPTSPPLEATRSNDPAFSNDPHLHPDFVHRGETSHSHIRQAAGHTPHGTAVGTSDEPDSSDLDTQLSQYMSSLSSFTHTDTSLPTTIEEEDEEEADTGLAYLNAPSEGSPRYPHNEPDRRAPPIPSRSEMRSDQEPPTSPPPPMPITQPERPSSTPPLLTPPARMPSRKSSSPGLRRPTVQDLDSIDELDETDPFGLSHHQAGPYDLRERMQVNAHPIRPAVGGPSWKPHTQQARRQSQMAPFVPLQNANYTILGTTSINLQPGQLLTTTPNAVLRMPYPTAPGPVPIRSNTFSHVHSGPSGRAPHPIHLSADYSTPPHAILPPIASRPILNGLDRRASAPYPQHRQTLQTVPNGCHPTAYPHSQSSGPLQPLADVNLGNVAWSQSAEQRSRLPPREAPLLQSSQSQHIPLRQPRQPPPPDIPIPPPTISEGLEMSTESASGPPRSNRFLPKRLVMPTPLSGASRAPRLAAPPARRASILSSSERKSYGFMKRSSSIATPPSTPLPSAKTEMAVVEAKQKNGRRLSKRRSIF